MNEKALLKSFTENAHSVGMNVMELLAGHLGIPPGELSRRHRIEAESGDHTRLTWAAGPGSDGPPPKTEAETPITTYAHTDFGSVTLLFNWLGGLQVENRHTGEWEWVRPLEGHAIYNMGDAMVEFSGGGVASGKHRVLAAPGEQAALERYSNCPNPYTTATIVNNTNPTSYDNPQVVCEPGGNFYTYYGCWYEPTNQGYIVANPPFQANLGHMTRERCGNYCWSSKNYYFAHVVVLQRGPEFLFVVLQRGSVVILVGFFQRGSDFLLVGGRNLCISEFEHGLPRYKEYREPVELADQCSIGTYLLFLVLSLAVISPNGSGVPELGSSRRELVSPSGLNGT
ncbi:MAG: hypothetical protein Q9162_004052 [Coniocarpon cinnabarinum]